MNLYFLVDGVEHYAPNSHGYHLGYGHGYKNLPYRNYYQFRTVEYFSYDIGYGVGKAGGSPDALYDGTE